MKTIVYKHEYCTFRFLRCTAEEVAKYNITGREATYSSLNIVENITGETLIWVGLSPVERKIVERIVACNDDIEMLSMFGDHEVRTFAIIAEMIATAILNSSQEI